MATTGGKPIATTNEVIESAVIRAPLSHVWHFIKLPEFHKFWSAIKEAEHVKGTSTETDVVKWTFRDGSVVEVKQDEHSNLDHFITYSVIESEPELTYSGVVSTIRCWPVTSGEFEDSTFVRWTSKFASDADLGVIEDAKYKRRDALKDLASAAAKMVKEHAK
ncbi:hypothetical protein NEMBOFW57_007111 [Staphylotrichum longicolle]|uniref:Bet v1-like protein n=1 Tax=Staphylotrichum longicolle TaxID=669026 RepID=A0AAD4HUZ5_9PEZI|nr:hypothetical protein NEMBOFW57_007111 [Staphylotrichum longicolle]